MYRPRLTLTLIIVLSQWTYLTDGENAGTLSAFINQPLSKGRDADPMVRMWRKRGEETKEWNPWEHYSGDGPPENWDPHRKSLKIKSDITVTSVVVNSVEGTPTPRDASSSSLNEEEITSSSMIMPVIPALQSSFVEDWSPVSSEFEGDLTRTSLPYEGPSSLFEMTAVMSSIVPITPSSSAIYDVDSPQIDSQRVPSSLESSTLPPFTDQLEPSPTMVPQNTDKLAVESSIFYTTRFSSDFTSNQYYSDSKVLMSSVVSFNSLYSTFIDPEPVTNVYFPSSTATIDGQHSYQSLNFLPENIVSSAVYSPSSSSTDGPQNYQSYQSFSFVPENLVSSVVFSPSPSFGDAIGSTQKLASTTFLDVSSKMVENTSTKEFAPGNSTTMGLLSENTTTVELASMSFVNYTEEFSSTMSSEIFEEFDATSNYDMSKDTMTKVPFSSEYLKPSVVIILVPSVHIVESWDMVSTLEKETINIVETPVNEFNTATWYGYPASSRLMIQSSDIDTPIFSENDPIQPQISSQPDTSDTVSLNDTSENVLRSTSFRVPRSLDPNEASDFSRSELEASDPPASDVITPSMSSDIVVIPETSVTNPDLASVAIEPSQSLPKVTPSMDAAGIDSKVVDPSPNPTKVVETNEEVASKTITDSVESKVETKMDSSKREGVHDEESITPTVTTQKDVESKLPTPTSITLPEITEVPSTTTTLLPTKDNQTIQPSNPVDNNEIQTPMTSLNLETSTTLTSKTEPPAYLLDKAYWIRTILEAESHKWKPYTWEDLPRRLERAYKLAHRRNYGLRDRKRRSVYEDVAIKVKLVGWAVDAIHGRTELYYVIAVDDVAVRATTASDIFKLITKEEMERDVGFELIVPAEPFKKDAALSTMTNGRQWVILVAIAVTGISIALLVCGALAYYRCCKKPPKTVDVDPESEPASPSYGFRNVEQALQEGTVTLSVVQSSDGEGAKSKKQKTPKTEEIESKRPLPDVPGTSTSSGSSDTDMATIKAKSKRFRTLLENEATQTENGIVNPAFEDSPIGTSRRKHARKAIKANGSASTVSPDSNNGYFDHVPLPSPPTSPHETDTLPSTAPLPPQEIKEGKARRHSNKVSASPPDVLPTEIKVREKINELLDDTIAKTTGRRLYNSARSKRIQPEKSERSLSPGFQSFRSPKHKKGGVTATFGDKHNSSVCETLAEHELSGKEDSSAPKVVWSTFKGESPGLPQSPTGSEDSRPGDRHHNSAVQTEPLFLHSDKHPVKHSGQVRDTPMTAPSSTPDSPIEGIHTHRGSMAASAPVLVDVHEKEGVNPDDYIGAVKVTEPAQSVIKAIRDELKKFNSTLPGTSTESNA